METKPNKTGRKSKYTPELVKDIKKLLEQGHTDKTVYNYVGIHADTFYAWIRENPEFSAIITKAREKAKVFLQARVLKASDEDWRAASWLMEHRYPKEYAIKTQLEHTGSVDIGIEKVVQNFLTKIESADKKANE